MWPRVISKEKVKMFIFRKIPGSDAALEWEWLYISIQVSQTTLSKEYLNVNTEDD